MTRPFRSPESRFTTHLAAQAKSVIALDFMKKFVEKNEERNSHFGNVKFVHADATKFDMDDARLGNSTLHRCLVFKFKFKFI